MLKRVVRPATAAAAMSVLISCGQTPLAAGPTSSASFDISNTMEQSAESPTEEPTPTGQPQDVWWMHGSGYGYFTEDFTLGSLVELAKESDLLVLGRISDVAEGPKVANEDVNAATTLLTIEVEKRAGSYDPGLIVLELRRSRDLPFQEVQRASRDDRVLLFLDDPRSYVSPSFKGTMQCRVINFCAVALGSEGLYSKMAEGALQNQSDYGQYTSLDEAFEVLSRNVG